MAIHGLVMVIVIWSSGCLLRKNSRGALPEDTVVWCIFLLEEEGFSMKQNNTNVRADPFSLFLMSQLHKSVARASRSHIAPEFPEVCVFLGERGGLTVRLMLTFAIGSGENENSVEGASTRRRQSPMLSRFQ